jgi:hypothetical protein
METNVLTNQETTEVKELPINSLFTKMVINSKETMNDLINKLINEELENHFWL